MLLEIRLHLRRFNLRIVGMNSDFIKQILSIADILCRTARQKAYIAQEDPKMSHKCQNFPANIVQINYFPYICMSKTEKNYVEQIKNQ